MDEEKIVLAGLAKKKAAVVKYLANCISSHTPMVDIFSDALQLKKTGSWCTVRGSMKIVEQGKDIVMPIAFSSEIAPLTFALAGIGLFFGLVYSIYAVLLVIGVWFIYENEKRNTIRSFMDVMNDSAAAARNEFTRK